MKNILRQTLITLAPAFCIFILTSNVHSYTINNLTSDFSNPFYSASNSHVNKLDSLKLDLFNGQLKDLLNISLTNNTPQTPNLAALKAIALFSVNQLAEGQKALQQADSMDADEGLILLAKALQLRKTAQLSEAQRIAEKCLNIMPDHPYAWNNLGRIQFERGDFEQALSSFYKAIKLNDNFFPAYLNAGAANLQLKNFRAALSIYTTLLPKAPEEKQAYIGQAWAYESLGHSKAAISTLDSYLAKYSSEIDVLDYKATLQQRSKDYVALLGTGQEL